MVPSQDKLRAALEMLKIRELRDLGYERDVDVSSNRKEDWVEELLQQDWSEDQFDGLINWIETLEREDQPRGRYMVKIGELESLGNSGSSQDFEQKLSNREVAFSEDKSTVESEGFEVEEKDDESLEGTYWTKTDDYILDPLGELRETSKIYGTGFEVDFSEDRLYIQASLHAKAQRLQNIAQELGLDMTPIGFQHLSNPKANEKMEEFVDDFESELESFDKQQRFGDFVSILQIKQVRIEVDGQNIKKVDFDGRRDIFDHDDVRTFVDDRDGRVVQIEGTMKYKGQDFFFKVGYDDDFGRFNIEKKGQRDGDLAIVDDATEFLDNIYQEHFAEPTV